MQLFVHPPANREDVEEEAKQMDPDASRRARRRLLLPVEADTILRIDLVARGLIIDEPIQQLLWHGSLECAQFEALVPRDHPGGTSILTATISVEGVPIGVLRGKIDVRVGECSGPTQDGRLIPQPTGLAHRFSKAFISYASKDRAEVLRRVQALQAVGIECFQDVLDLAPGERWELSLYRHIDECDLFLLFWSWAARESEWVAREVDYAVARKGGDDAAQPEIRPVIVEGPPVPPPPKSLAHLHFNDLLLYCLVNEPTGIQDPSAT